MGGFLKIFVCLALGELLANFANVPLPGSVIGLLLLLADFARQGGPDESVARLFDVVSPHLTLLFIPAGAGVIAYGGMLGENWWIVLGAVTAGTVLTMVITALAFQALVLRGRDQNVRSKMVRRLTSDREFS